ncbi:MAG TPA: hypothetical protein DDZ53_13030 [Firmicutes bacterium]|nr:hypothetical protein [Bacillota bacterium]
MKCFRQGATVGLVLLLVMAMALPAVAGDLAKQQAEYERVQKEIAQIEKRINTNKQQSKSVSSEISRLDKEIYQAEEQLSYLETRLRTTDLEIKATEKDLADAEERLDFRQDMLKTRLRALYERGSVSYLEVLFNARSFSDLINRIGLLQRVVAQDVTVVDSIKTEKVRIEEQKHVLDTKRAEYDVLYRETDSNRNAIESRKADRTKYQTKLKNDRAELEKSLEESEQRQQALAELIREAQGSNPNSSQGTGQYVWPTPGITKINSWYGQRNDPFTGKKKFHYAIDIGAPMGAKIVAVDSGTVLYSGWMTGYGKVVIIDHGNNRATLYAHTSVLMVSNNQKVTKGQQIAKVGSTGWSTGAHLHFEFRVNGVRKNPLDYVKRP